MRINHFNNPTTQSNFNNQENAFLKSLMKVKHFILEKLQNTN